MKKFVFTEEKEKWLKENYPICKKLECCKALGVTYRELRKIAQECGLVEYNVKNLPDEIWRDVVGYEDLYQVSNMGRVKSKDKVVKMRWENCNLKERLLKLRYVRQGYYQVNLHKEGEQRYLYVHRLVAEAFIGKIPQGYQVDHINNNRTDNCLSNLQIVTSKENMRFCRQRGYKSPSGWDRKNRQLHTKQHKKFSYEKNR